MELRLMLQLLQSVETLRRHERWTREQLAVYQGDSLRRLREFATAHSPFYRDFHHGMADRPLHELPVLTKAMLMEHFDDVVTDGAIRLEDIRAHLAGRHGARLYLGRYVVNSTSGSTGRPGLFLFDRSEWLSVLASFGRAHEWAGVHVSLRHRMKMASVASTSPAHMSARVGTSLQSWWMPALRLAASEPLAEVVRQLNRWQPDMLVAYASMARILAEEQIAGQLRIHPHLVFTSSEVLTEDARRRIEAAWGLPAFNQYASTETGGLAAETTDHNGLEVFEDQVIVEPVDADYRPVPPGVFADRLLVTVLFNRTQPLIRYELSDSVRFSTAPNPSGRPFARIDEVQGRTEDILHLPSPTGAQVAVHPVVFHAAFDRLPVGGWQVVQEAGILRVLLAGVADGEVQERAVVDNVTHALRAAGVDPPLILVERVPAIPRTASGKAPLVLAQPPLSLTTDARL